MPRRDARFPVRRVAIEADEAMPPPPPRTSDATLSAKRIGNFRPRVHFGVRRRTVDTFAMHAILGHISGIFIDVVNLRLFTSFTVDYSWKKFFAPPRKNPDRATTLDMPLPSGPPRFLRYYRRGTLRQGWATGSSEGLFR